MYGGRDVDGNSTGEAGDITGKKAKGKDFEMKKQRSASAMALSGVLCALSVSILFLGGAIPLAEVVSPALSAIVLLPLGLEYDRKLHLTAYAAVSLLSLILVPQKELVFLFLFLLGYYPCLKDALDGSIKSKPLRAAVKFLWLNASIAVCYGLLYLLFPVQMGEDGELILTVVTLVICYPTFFLYDNLLGTLKILYLSKRKKR